MVALCQKIDEVYNWGISNKLLGKKGPGELKDEDIVDNIPENFCILPFARLQIDPDGRAKPCCKYKNILNLPHWWTKFQISLSPHKLSLK